MKDGLLPQHLHLVFLMCSCVHIEIGSLSSAGKLAREVSYMTLTLTVCRAQSQAPANANGTFPTAAASH